jgi:type 1 glutamine amidotransferase
MRTFSRVALALLVAVGAVRAADARPIRVALYKGTGCCASWHTSIHTAGANIARMLAAPTQVANLGAAPIVPAAGFAPSFYGLASGQGAPIESQRDAFLRALDTVDVAVFINSVNIPQLFPDSAQRARLESFSRARGVVALHASADNQGAATPWPAWDALLAGRFMNHPSGDRNATLRLDTAARHQAAWRLLNHGLPDTARFVEEWFSFMESGAEIREVPGLKVTVNIDEASYQGGLGSARAMGDHPMSWYREFPQGGRFFYTAVGHRAQNYDSLLAPAFFFRRQIYNAILWAAKVDSTGTVAVPPSRHAAADWTLRKGARGLLLEFGENGPRTVELFAPNGGRVLRRVARGSLLLQAPVPGLHVLRVSTGAGSAVRRVVLP